MQVGIIGVGLIGGSMAVDLKNRGFADRVVGVEADALHASAAKELGLVDEIVSYEECIAMSDMIVVAVPVSIAIRMIPDILDKVDRQVVTDVCSTKEKINDMVRYHPNRKNFVAVIYFFFINSNQYSYRMILFILLALWIKSFTPFSS